MERQFKWFFNPVEGRQRYLNEMAQKGYQLVSSGSLIHKFKKTDDKKRRYMVEYIGYMTGREKREYLDFIQGMGLETISAPLNIGKIAFGNVRWRPYNTGKASLATSRGLINKEILIIENKSGKEFSSHTDPLGKKRNLEMRKRPYYYLLVCSVILFLLGVLKNNINNIEGFSKTLISFRPLENVAWGWISIGALMFFYSLMSLKRINNLLKSVKGYDV